MLKQRLSPLIIVVIIIVLLAVIASIYLLLMHRKERAPEAPTITNDPYAGQYSGPPTGGNPEDGAAP